MERSNKQSLPQSHLQKNQERSSISWLVNRYITIMDDKPLHGDAASVTYPKPLGQASSTWRLCPWPLPDSAGVVAALPNLQRVTTRNMSASLEGGLGIWEDLSTNIPQKIAQSNGQPLLRHVLSSLHSLPSGPFWLPWSSWIRLS